MTRLFFAYSLSAPWPSSLPRGRLLQPEMRHCTLAFLGESSLEELLPLCDILPMSPFRWGLLGQLREMVFLPENQLHVAAAEILFEETVRLNGYYEQFIKHLAFCGYPALEKNRFYPHVTLARAPFDQNEWSQLRMYLPVWTPALHLYESVGHLEYVSRWSHPFEKPYEEISHTADSAFHVYGDSPWRLYLHAAYAIGSLCPEMMPFFDLQEFLPPFHDQVDTGALEAIIAALNRWVTYADTEVGIPIKAVSYHTVFEQRERDVVWEMIIDV